MNGAANLTKLRGNGRYSKVGKQNNCCVSKYATVRQVENLFPQEFLKSDALRSLLMHFGSKIAARRFFSVLLVVSTEMAGALNLVLIHRAEDKTMYK